MTFFTLNASAAETRHPVSHISIKKAFRALIFLSFTSNKSRCIIKAQARPSLCGIILLWGFLPPVSQLLGTPTSNVSSKKATVFYLNLITDSIVGVIFALYCDSPDLIPFPVLTHYVKASGNCSMLDRSTIIFIKRLAHSM